MLCCFASSRRKNGSMASSVDARGNEVFIDDLVLNPNKIDAKLESRIAEWQNAINDYQAFEDICREEIEDELIPILEQLREKPALFRDKRYSINIQTLAAKLIKANEMQSRLESSNRDDDSSSLGARLKYYCCYPCAGGSVHKNESESTLRSTVAASNNYSMSEKLSAKWALRLNELDPTQGSLQRASVSGGGAPYALGSQPDPAAPIKFKPKWPDFLIDTYFDVIKINMYGRKMRRIIKLNQHYVVNITNGNEISKFYAYREIRRVWLESGDTIVVVLKNGKQSVYMSHIAPHVLQQLTTRVQVRRSLDKAEFYGPAFNLGYSAAVTAGIIKSISEENTLDSEAVVAMFATELKERTVRSIRGDSGETPSTGSSKRGGSVQSSSTLPTLSEEPEDGSAAANPLHRQLSSGSAGTGASSNSSKGASSVPPAAPTFTSPFTNAINNSNADLTALSRTVTNTSEVNSEMSFHTADSIPNFPPPPGPAPATAAAPSSSAIASAAPRLLSFSEGMPEYAVQSAIQTLIFDTSTSEGNTRKIFIDKFKSACIVSLAQSALTSAAARATMHANHANAGASNTSARRGSKGIGAGATLLEVRHFIDGMHEYILSNRGVSLSLMFEREKQRAIILQGSAAASSIAPSGDSSGNLAASGPGTPGGSSPVPGAPAPSPGGRGISRGSSKRPMLGRQTSEKGADFKNWQSPNSTAVVESELTSRASLQFLKDNNMDLSMIEEKIVIFISFIIFMVVEEAIFLPLKADLINLLPSSSKQEEEQLLLEKMKALSVRTQQQWGIPDELVSPLGWQSAVFELQGLEHNLTPSTQLHVLTRTVKAIYNEFKHVILPILKAKGISQSCIAADDLVPIFIFIFCRSNLKHPMRSRDLMWSLCHPDQLQGEGGYYLTVFESSIEFVLGEEIARDSFVYSYNTNPNSSVSLAEEASKKYISEMRRGSGGAVAAAGGGDSGRQSGSGKWASGGSGGRLFSTGSSRSSGNYADAAAAPGGVFDISGDFINTGVNSNRSSGSAAGQHQQQRKDSRQHSDSSTGSYSDARGTLSGRDSIMSTLAQRLTLSNLLTRKPAPDNTTRESFN